MVLSVREIDFIHQTRRFTVTPSKVFDVCQHWPLSNSRKLGTQFIIIIITLLFPPRSIILCYMHSRKNDKREIDITHGPPSFSHAKPNNYYRDPPSMIDLCGYQWICVIALMSMGHDRTEIITNNNNYRIYKTDISCNSFSRMYF